MDDFNNIVNLDKNNNSGQTPNTNQEIPNINQQTPNTNQQSPNMNQQAPNMYQQSPNMNQQAPNMNQPYQGQGNPYTYQNAGYTVNVNPQQMYPPCALKWNWGAAFQLFAFGIVNKAYMCLLGLIPVLNAFWWIVAGIYGGRWAWDSGEFRTADELERSLKGWNRLGIVTLIIIGAMFIIYLIFGAVIVASIAAQGHNHYF